MPAKHMASYGILGKSCRILAGNLGTLLTVRALYASTDSRRPILDRLGEFLGFLGFFDGHVTPSRRLLWQYIGIADRARTRLNGAGLGDGPGSSLVRWTAV